MVRRHTDNHKTIIVLAPNRSMTWETNKKILLVMFIVAMIIGLSFAYIGAWLVLPFAGLEIMLLGAGMYYVCWKLNFKQTISMQAESLILQQGVYFPKEQWHWQKSATSLIKQPSRYRMSPPALFLKHLNQTVEIGAFLNRSEKATLREYLIHAGIPMTVIAASDVIAKTARV